MGAAGPSAAEALARFAGAYAQKTGCTLEASALQIRTEMGRTLEASAVLPCGIPSGSDLFVGGAAPAPGAASTQVYAKEGSKVAASQSKMGENSYYYSVGKNKGLPAEASIKPDLRDISVAPAAVKEETLSSYQMIDDDGVVKVRAADPCRLPRPPLLAHRPPQRVRPRAPRQLSVPFAGAGALPQGAISASFRDRSFDLRVRTEGRVQRLHVPILLEEIEQQRCAVKKLAGKLVLTLAKRDASKPWWELRKTKGVGETDFHKIVPDAGEEVVVTL